MQSPTFELHTPINILVDRRKALGDAIMITPVIHELKKRYPKSKISVLTEEEDVFDNNPDVDVIYTPVTAPPDLRWDLYYNLNDAYEVNIKNHFVDNYFFRVFGTTEGFDKTLRLYETEEEAETAQEAIEAIGSDYIVLHMRRWFWENKNISLDTWSELLTRLSELYPDLKFVSVGSEHDTALPSSDRYIALNGQLSLGQLKCVIAGAKAFIGSDSGPFHVAATTMTPIVALLSHVTPQHIVPWRRNQFGHGVWVSNSDVPCTGCYARQQTPVRNLTCENSEQWACSRKFDVNDIVNQLREIMSL